MTYALNLVSERNLVIFVGAILADNASISPAKIPQNLPVQVKTII
ncbi:MAG: hypothetical protein WBV73_13875 [Phormidium sp.]